MELLTQLKVDPLQRDYEYSLTALDYAVGQYANATIARIILKVRHLQLPSQFLKIYNQTCCEKIGKGLELAEL